MKKSILKALLRAYYKIGMHTAQSGTFLYVIHRSLKRCFLPNKNEMEGELSCPSSDFLYASPDVREGELMGDISRSNGIALIFFMGAGDCLYTTPALRRIRQLAGKRPIKAYVSKNVDKYNSPLVAQFLGANSDIDEVVFYDGAPPRTGNWKNYDWSEAKSLIPDGYCVWPVFYDDADVDVPHRVCSVFDYFGLKREWPVPVPNLSVRVELSEHVSELVSRCLEKVAEGYKLCILHLDARSSGYDYFQKKTLIERLVGLGFYVVSFTPCDVSRGHCQVVDLSVFTLLDSVDFLAALRDASTVEVHLICVNSVFWPISSALNIKLLGLHIFHDPSVHQYWYPNIYLMTPFISPKIPASRKYMVGDDDYVTEDKGGHALLHYSPETIIDALNAVFCNP